MNNPTASLPPYIHIGVRLQAERKRLGFKQVDFASKVGVSKTAQFNYEVGERAPDADYLRKASGLGLDILFVVTGTRAVGEDDFVVIPRYDLRGAALRVSEPGAEEQPPGVSFSRNWLARRSIPASRLRVIDVSGDSMAKRLAEGDQVVMDVADTTPKSGRAYVLRQGDEVLVKYCQLLPGRILRVSSENPAYPSYDIDLNRVEEVSIVGRVVASVHEW